MAKGVIQNGPTGWPKDVRTDVPLARYPWQLNNVEIDFYFSAERGAPVTVSMTREEATRFANEILSRVCQQIETQPIRIPQPVPAVPAYQPAYVQPS